LTNSLNPNENVTELLESDDTMYDTRTGLVWIRDLTHLGTTPKLFAKTIEGAATLRGDFLRLEEQVAQLSYAESSSWRIATKSELEELGDAGGGSLFFAFARTQGLYENLAGVYKAGPGEPAVWGYQYRNVLVGPIERWGDLTQTDYGVWIVSGPGQPPSADWKPIPEAREPHVEQVVMPVVAGTVDALAPQKKKRALRGIRVQFGHRFGYRAAVSR